MRSAIRALAPWLVARSFVVKFENGVMTPVSKKVMSSAFRRRVRGAANG